MRINIEKILIGPGLNRLKSAYFVIILLALTGCANSVKLSDQKYTPDPEQNRNYKIAMEHYINGLAEEAKNDYANAILEFQEALRTYQSAAIYYSLGKNYYVLNRLASALENSKKAVMLDSSNIEYAYLLQDIYFAARQHDSAMTVLEDIIRRDSSEYDAYYKLARLYEVNRPQQAIMIYKRLLKNIGAEWNTLQHLAEIYDRLGDLDGCITTLKELLSLDSGNTELELLLVETMMKAKQNDQAIQRLNDMLIVYPDNISIIEKKAQILIEQNKWKEAAESYKKAFNDPVVSKEAKMRIGALYLSYSLKDSSLLPIAKEIFTPLDRDTSDWDVKMYLGAIAMAEKKDSVAIDYFSLAISMAPWNADAWIRLGGLYFDNRRYNEAIKMLSQAADKFPESFPIQLILGISYLQLEDFANSEKHLAKAADLNETDLNTLSSYGYVLNKLNKTDEAIECLNKALNIDPKSIDILSTLGLIYDDHEMWPQCDSIYTIALKIDSSNALINNNFAYSLSKRGLNLEHALRMVTLSLEKEPHNSSYLDTKGWIYFQLDKLDSAKKYIEESLKIGGEKSVILDHLADVLYKMGRKSEALDTWKKALEKEPTNIEIKNKIERGTF